MNKKRTGRVGIFACDPGTTTGLAWGVINIDDGKKLPVFDLVKRDLRMVSQVAQSDPGPDKDWRHSELAAAKIIALKILELRTRWIIAGIPATHHDWVFEDFILYPNQQHGSERSGLSPVRMTSYIQGILVDFDDEMNYVYQGAGNAKRFATDARLKSSNLWVPGLEHGRDATRHLCFRAATLF